MQGLSEVCKKATGCLGLPQSNQGEIDWEARYGVAGASTRNQAAVHNGQLDHPAYHLFGEQQSHDKKA